ncbi:glycohydrolase toxin TNT-related protein [Granulicatella adiacens]
MVAFKGKVLKGKIAPWFEQIGGGTQSRLDPSFVELINAIPSDESAIIKKLIKYGYLRRL